VWWFIDDMTPLQLSREQREFLCWLINHRSAPALKDPLLIEDQTKWGVPRESCLASKTIRQDSKWGFRKTYAVTAALDETIPPQKPPITQYLLKSLKCLLITYPPREMKELVGKVGPCHLRSIQQDQSLTRPAPLAPAAGLAAPREAGGMIFDRVAYPPYISEDGQRGGAILPFPVSAAGCWTVGSAAPEGTCVSVAMPSKTDSLCLAAPQMKSADDIEGPALNVSSIVVRERSYLSGELRGSDARDQSP